MGTPRAFFPIFLLARGSRPQETRKQKKLFILPAPSNIFCRSFDRRMLAEHREDRGTHARRERQRGEQKRIKSLQAGLHPDAPDPEDGTRREFSSHRTTSFLVRRTSAGHALGGQARSKKSQKSPETPDGPQRIQASLRRRGGTAVPAELRRRGNTAV